MASTTLQEVSRELAKVGERIWDCIDPFNSAIEGVLEILDIRLRILKKLQVTVHNLIGDYSDNRERGRFLSRITVFLKFVHDTREFPDDRSLSLRQLKPPALILCALSHTTTEIKDSSDLYFSTLVGNLDDFVHRRNLTQHFFRDDVARFVLFNRRTVESCFADFKISYNNLRSEILKTSSPLPSSIPEAQHGNNFQLPDTAGASTQTKRFRGEGLTTCGSPARYSRFTTTPEPPGDNYFRFRMTKREKVLDPEQMNKVFEKISEGIITCDRWKEEVESQGLKVTECLSLYLPKYEQDAFILIQINRDVAWIVSKILHLGE